MTDASDDPAGERPVDSPNEADAGDRPAPEEGAETRERPAGDERDRLSPEEIEERYDFEDFGPRDMAEMTYEEWEAVFDHDSWITGRDLLDRVEADLKNRVADRDVFAVVERIEREGEPQLLAYSDEGYAVVYPDGTVEGSGTVLRDVKPSVALASMESYDVPEMPEGEVLPDPAEVPEGSGQLGNQLMQIIAAAHVLAGVGLFAAWIAVGLPIVAAVAALGFFVFGVFVFLLVANARLSDRFRAEEYRNRLRAVGLEDEERPDFLPGEGGESSESLADAGEPSDDGAAETGVSSASESGN
ncbi:hypothetical protein M0R88_13330 [Halorussus gelatinilyticus]|uniref:DUF7319 domain-containing protein n=1 Tax=Halorussus gelatinilyticus TaxID=2937524 RepID=A0A8U0IEJ7_9EURY|nr:hypothetical protein [Halorussus gelatinilyticus]UPV99496.1 hypothetical protein M0R88_13330 [Halorussus gelatinilyticus]